MSKIVLEFSHEEIDQVIMDLQKLAVVQTMDQIREDVAKTFRDDISRLTTQIAEINTPKSKTIGKLNGRWSRKYEDCRDCHSQAKKHLGNGYCTTCYFKHVARKTIIPLDVKSTGVDSRPHTL